MNEKARAALQKYREDVKAGLRAAPSRNTDVVTRKLAAELDGTFGPDRGRRLIITLKPDGIIELRPERTTRVEKIHVMDVYRYAIRCRVNVQLLAKARERKEKKAARLARQRQERAEKRLFIS